MQKVYTVGNFFFSHFAKILHIFCKIFTKYFVCKIFAKCEKKFLQNFCNFEIYTLILDHVKSLLGSDLVN